MIRRMLLLPALAALFLPAAADAARIYKCRNDKGEIFYSQTYDRTRCAGGGAEMNEQGLPVRTIDRIKTPEELAADKARAEAEAEAQRLADEQKRQDQILLASYANEEDIQRAHEQQLQNIDQAIFAARMAVQNQEKSLADLLGSAAEAERAGKPVPEAVTRNISLVRRQIEEQNAFILRKEQDKKALGAEHEQQLARYRELVARQEELQRQASQR